MHRFLQLFDVKGDRGLGIVQPLGCGSEAAGLGNGLQSLQIFQLHPDAPFIIQKYQMLSLNTLI